MIRVGAPTTRDVVVIQSLYATPGVTTDGNVDEDADGDRYSIDIQFISPGLRRSAVSAPLEIDGMRLLQGLICRSGTPYVNFESHPV